MGNRISGNREKNYCRKCSKLNRMMVFVNAGKSEELQSQVRSSSLRRRKPIDEGD